MSDSSATWASYGVLKDKGKGRYSSSWEPHLELRDVTCHTGSTVLPATRHKRTRPALTPAMQAGTRFTYPGGMEG